LWILVAMAFEVASSLRLWAKVKNTNKWIAVAKVLFMARFLTANVIKKLLLKTRINLSPAGRSFFRVGRGRNPRTPPGANKARGF
jgi:hypothetical protein